MILRNLEFFIYIEIKFLNIESYCNTIKNPYCRNHKYINKKYFIETYNYIKTRTQTVKY